jgi:glycosyltransferase involved in cell wall biosynthesis
MGVKCQQKPDRADVVLGALHWREEIGDMPSVLRIDGVHLLDTPRSHWCNKRIRKSAKRADAVIWQSTFCRDVFRAILGLVHPHEYIIHNGADPKDYDVEPTVSPFKINIILSARFKDRPQKGLPEMYQLATVYLPKHPEACVWVCGKIDEHFVSRDRIRFLGHLEEAELRRVLKMGSCLLYLASYDWCPNAVIEAMAAGLPVVYLRGHALDEVVGDSGVGVNRARPLKLTMTSHKDRPRFDMDEAVAAVEKAVQMPRVVRPDLHINAIAAKYLEVLKFAVENHK